MKLATPFTLFAATIALLAAATFGSASAAECTVDQTLANAKIQLSITSGSECKNTYLGGGSETDICADSKCVEAITKGLKKIEDCTVVGRASLTATLEKAISGCKTSSSSSSASTTSTPATGAAGATPTPTPASNASSSKNSVICVAASTIVAVYAMRM